MDQRVGVQAYTGHDEGAGGTPNEKQKMRVQGAKRRLVEDVRMSDREVEMAIRITEEKLGVLKQAVEEKKIMGLKGQEGGEDAAAAGGSRR